MGNNHGKRKVVRSMNKDGEGGLWDPLSDQGDFDRDITSVWWAKGVVMKFDGQTWDFDLARLALVHTESMGEVLDQKLAIVADTIAKHFDC